MNLVFPRLHEVFPRQKIENKNSKLPFLSCNFLCEVHWIVLKRDDSTYLKGAIVLLTRQQRPLIGRGRGG